MAVPERNRFKDGRRRSLGNHAGCSFYFSDPDLFCGVGAVREIL